MVVIVLALLACFFLSFCGGQLDGLNLDSPVSPRYPLLGPCGSGSGTGTGTGTGTQDAGPLTKRTNKKFLLGVMFKDEEGYLEEFLSYYKVQGIDHVILWNNNSTDGSLREIAPWVASGFAEVRDLEPLNQSPNVRYGSTAKFYRMMALKKETERQNLLWGVLNGYDYYITGDLDEYAFAAPSGSQQQSIITREGKGRNNLGEIVGQSPVLTAGLADGIESLFWPPMDRRGPAFKPRLYLPIIKYNYNAAPHLLEPPDTLTLEAYSLRYEKPGGMNHYMNVMPKYVYRLRGADLSAGEPSTLIYYPDTQQDFNSYRAADLGGKKLTDMQVFLTNCCYIHGCETKNPRNSFCFALGKKEAQFGFETKIWSAAVTAHAQYSLRMNHYARSFEKHALKARTWATANHISATGYDLKEYLHRAYGSVHDPILLQVACAVRREWSRMTGHPIFMRYGDSLSRRVEFNYGQSNHSSIGIGVGVRSIPYNTALYAQGQEEAGAYPNPNEEAVVFRSPVLVPGVGDDHVNATPSLLFSDFYFGN